MCESAGLGSRLREFCIQSGAGPAVADAIELCTVEGFNNAAEHALGNDSTKTITVMLEFVSGVVSVAIQDDGRAMDSGRLESAEMPQPDPKDTATWRDRGRGLPIIKNLMDHVTYESVGGHNTLCFRKHL